MKARSSVVLDLVAKVDTQGSSQAELAAACEKIRSAYVERQLGILIGLFSKCYLGAPYVDHVLDVFGNICQHFAPTDDVQYPYSQARALVRNPAYAFIEIYSDGSIVPVRPDGTPVKTNTGVQ